MNEKSHILTVSALNNLVKNTLEQSALFQRIYIKGAISNWKNYRSGIFFDLVDEKGSTLSCLMWNDAASKLAFPAKNSDEVVAFGSINVYAQRGRYSLTVWSLRLDGLGAQLLALEALKKKLASEGLFDASRKRPIPAFPQRIGIIVGAKSAAEADLVRNIHRRWPLTEVHEFPSLVQGPDAPRSLRNALSSAIKAKVDTLIIARGGGSSEDLSAFNDEALTRELAASPIPTISAVGHEIDTTMVDYVSDLRVSTPTAAAEAATPDQNEIKERLLSYEDDLRNSLQKCIDFKRHTLSNLSGRPFFKNPQAQYDVFLKTIQSTQERLSLATRNLVERKNISLTHLGEKLKALNPKNIIKRGYSVLSDEKGQIITSSKKVSNGQKIRTMLDDGTICSIVTGKE